MPLYEYRCGACGHELEVLQKISDPAPVDCPACHQASLQKKLSAAGFQLKGTGWYVTDFRGGKSATSEPAIKSEGEPKSAPNEQSLPASNKEGSSAGAESTTSPSATTGAAAASAPAAQNTNSNNSSAST
jgi:putative FmdB family regulatory protein